MSTTINIVLSGLLTILISFFFFKIAEKSPKEYKNILIITSFYFLGLTFIFLMVAVGYGFNHNVTCEWVVNNTITDNNLTNQTDTQYYYINTCADNDYSAIENLYIILLWNFYLIILGCVILIWYMVYKWIKNIW